MISENDAWLALMQEEVIEPDLPIIDSHFHLWDLPVEVYNWGTPHYLLDEFLQDSRGHNIVQSVFTDSHMGYRKTGPVEMQPVGETEFVDSIAEESIRRNAKTKVAAGIVAYADLSLGEAVIPVLEGHVAASKRFRGIRNHFQHDAAGVPPSAHLYFGVTSYSPTPHMMADPKLREGAKCLDRYGLSFDIAIYHHHFDELIDLAKDCKNTPIIVGHYATPLGVGPYAGKRREIFQEWKRGMANLAALPNVNMKIGGFGMPMNGFDWHLQAKPPSSAELVRDMAPYIETCIELFGTERCMFETNFPPDKISYSYTTVWNAYKLASKGYSVTERTNLFHDTAARVYRI